MSIAVADAGPLIHLNEIQGISLLAGFEAILVSSAVWQETVTSGRVSKEVLLGLSAFKRETVAEIPFQEFVQAQSLSNLQRGEQEALYLGAIHAIPIVLTDDLNARGAAKRLNMTPVGSLGIVVRAFYDGRTSRAQAEDHINALYQVSSLFVTRAIVDLAIEQIRSRNR
ncbi:MAG: hypothetical protein WCF84_10630 [Anaerolineae bacterium]